MKDPVLKEVDGKPKDDLRLSSGLHLDTHTHAYKHMCNHTHRNIIYTYIKKKKPVQWPSCVSWGGGDRRIAVVFTSAVT